MESIDTSGGGFAVGQVLEAERAAKELIATARLEAEQSLEQARALARALEQRAVESTQKIQQAARHFGEQRLACLERETQRRLEQAQQEHPEATIDALARRLAQELVGIGLLANPESSPLGERNP